MINKIQRTHDKATTKATKKKAKNRPNLLRRENSWLKIDETKNTKKNEIQVCKWVKVEMCVCVNNARRPT